jgi:glutamine synthetase
MADDLLASLRNSGTRFVRVVWCDNANVIRAKAVHIAALPGYLEHGLGITAAQQAIPALFDAVVPGSGLGPVGEIRLMPDWSTLTPLPYAAGHARVMGDMVLAGRPWALCPRDFLRRSVARVEEMGFEVQAAFENEFYLLRQTPVGVVPHDETVFAATLSMDRARTIIDDITETLLAQKVPVELYYPESGPGQHELSVQHTSPLEAANRQIVFRETVHAIAARHGLKASFLPKVFADRAGSGCHLHLSLWQGSSNAFADPKGPGGLSPVGLGFIAGLLEHLPALMALTTPSTNSYRRIRPHFWSGAFRCWGVDNREAAVRVPTDPTGRGTRHIELKTSDASANPYLALGAVLAAGLDGVRRRLSPREPVNLDPGSLTDEDRQRQHIDALPTSLGRAVEQLERDTVLLEALGPELARAFLAVRRAEWEGLRSARLDDEVQLLLERY